MQETEPMGQEKGWEEETDLSKKLTKHLKVVRAAYESAVSSAEKINLNLYVVPKLMQTVKDVETENLRRREQGEEEINVAEFSDFKKLIEYGLLEKDNSTKHIIDGMEQTVHRIGHLTGIKDLVQKEREREHPGK